MQAAGRSSQYKGVLDAYLSIARKEGIITGLYRGLGPNICRNAIVNACETVVYDVTKVHFYISSSQSASQSTLLLCLEFSHHQKPPD